MSHHSTPVTRGRQDGQADDVIVVLARTTTGDVRCFAALGRLDDEARLVTQEIVEKVVPSQTVVVVGVKVHRARRCLQTHSSVRRAR